ncbi:hypothetical protein GCM10011505_41470 [Tistrella bauzanensis]|uniref:Uncharacterized protein n=1 Tax=Tistrella bauzanensis TaxID=657419 RepID=A0ABQ1IZV3_9PROT|nr:hypothetical protein [Tistrella bauzanensis]GGB56252.1 hypothetical protein GCM10011505_41470 [Tistrella bauzanensis]
MPTLVRFVLMHALVGFGLAFATVGALLWFDVSGLGTLMAASADGVLAAAVLIFFMGLTLGSVQVAFAVWFQAGEDQGTSGGRRMRLPAMFLPPRRAMATAPSRAPRG